MFGSIWLAAFHLLLHTVVKLPNVPMMHQEGRGLVAAAASNDTDEEGQFIAAPASCNSGHRFASKLALFVLCGAAVMVAAMRVNHFNMRHEPSDRGAIIFDAVPDAGDKDNYTKSDAVKDAGDKDAGDEDDKAHQAVSKKDKDHHAVKDADDKDQKDHRSDAFNMAFIDESTRSKTYLFDEDDTWNVLVVDMKAGRVNFKKAGPPDSAWLGGCLGLPYTTNYIWGNLEYLQYTGGMRMDKPCGSLWTRWYLLPDVPANACQKRSRRYALWTDHEPRDLGIVIPHGTFEDLAYNLGNMGLEHGCLFRASYGWTLGICSHHQTQFYPWEINPEPSEVPGFPDRDLADGVLNWSACEEHGEELIMEIQHCELALGAGANHMGIQLHLSSGRAVWSDLNRRGGHMAGFGMSTVGCFGEVPEHATCREKTAVRGECDVSLDDFKAWSSEYLKIYQYYEVIPNNLRKGSVNCQHFKVKAEEYLTGKVGVIEQTRGFLVFMMMFGTAISCFCVCCEIPIGLLATVGTTFGCLALMPLYIEWPKTTVAVFSCLLGLTGLVSFWLHSFIFSA